MMQLTSEEALDMYDSKIWETWSNKEIFLFQISQQYCCIDFIVFMQACNDVLERPVFTHEMSKPHQLFMEYIGKVPKRSLSDVLKVAEDLVGDDKLIIVGNEDG